MIVIISEHVSAESERDPPIPADRTPAVLGGMDDLQLLAIVGSEPRGSERRAAACEVLVGRYRGMVCPARSGTAAARSLPRTCCRRDISA